MRFEINHSDIYSNRLFQNLQPQDITLKISNKNLIEINEDGIIYNHGDKSDCMYLLLKGEVRLKIYDSHHNVSYLTKNVNDFFGEAELINNSPRQSAAMATEKSLLYLIHRKELNDLIKNKAIKANLLGYVLPDDNNQTEKENQKLDVENGIENKSEMENDASQLQLNNFTNEIHIVESESSVKQPPSQLNSSINQAEHLSSGSEAVFDYSDDETLPPVVSAVTNKNEILTDESIIDRIQKEIEESQETLNGSETLTQSQTENAVAEATNNSEISTAKESQKTLTQQSDKLDQKLVESLFEEIKVPIKLIRSYAELLRQKSKSPEANKILQKIIEQTDLVLNSLRVKSESLQEEIELKAQVLYAAKVLNDILLLLAGYTEFRGIKLYRKFEADASIVIDKNLFYQACLQIVKLLCENIGDERNIFVELSRTKETVIIKFKDGNSDISGTVLNELLSVNGISSSTNLSFAKTIIEKHNGTISAKKNNDGAVEITISLPIVK